MIELGNFQQYQTYFSTIAADHKELDAADPYLFGDEEVGSNKIRSWGTGKKLWLEPPQPARLLDGNSDNLLLDRPSAFTICGAAGSKLFADEYNYYKACEAIVIDVIARMRKDYSAATLKVVIDWPASRLNWVELTLGGTKLIGCRLDFSYRDPSGFPYTEAKWKSED